MIRNFHEYMNNFKNNKKLIALIMIVLLVFAIIAILTSTRESIIFKKVTDTTNKMSQEEAKEKIESEISNLISINTETVTIDDFIEYIQDSMKIKKESATTAIIGLDEYAFRINENLEIIDEVSISLLSYVEATYEVNSTSQNRMNITVIIKSDVDIDRIITPDGREISIKDKKNKVGIDYVITAEDTYIFKVQLKGSTELKEYILNDRTSKKPIIDTSTSAAAYPVLSGHGVYLSKNVNIDYGDEISNYYSIDNGKTWKFYNGKVEISEKTTVLAKTIVENEITKIDREEIEFNMASDALGKNAYDGNNSTADSTTSQKYIYIESSIWNHEFTVVLKYRATWDTLYFRFYDSNNTLIGDAIGIGNNDLTNGCKTLKVPSGAQKLGYSYSQATSGCGLVEIYPETTPKYRLTDLMYPILESTGIKTKTTCKVALTYYYTSTRRLYKINDGEWQDYLDEEIELNLGETIYIKGIDKNNKETKTVTYTAVTPSDMLTNEAFDKDNKTLCYTKSVKFNVDSSAWNKTFSFYSVGASEDRYSNVEIYAYDSNGNKISTTVLAECGFYSQSKTVNIVIPENTVYMVTNYKGNSGIYEISVTN